MSEAARAVARLEAAGFVLDWVQHAMSGSVSAVRQIVGLDESDVDDALFLGAIEALGGLTPAKSARA